MVSLRNLLSAALLASTAFALPPPLRRDSGNQTVTQSKRGAAFNDINAVQALDANGAISWAYNWAASPGGTLPDGVEYVPMLWGAKSIGDFVASIENVLLRGGSKYILGFNEPDASNQAAMSVSDAVTTFKQFITPYAGRATLVSPSVTNSQDQGSGLSWLREFLSSCSDCGIGVLAVHWYGSDAQDFMSFIQQAIDLANQQGLKEVWVTEFALASELGTGGLTSASTDFLRQVRPWLDRQSMVTRYAYFWAQQGFLVQGNQPSSAGWAYIG